MLFYYNLIGLNTKYFTDFRSMIVQEGKSYGSTKHIIDESVFETLNNEEKKNSVEPLNTTVDDFHEFNILDSVHPKMYVR